MVERDESNNIHYDLRDLYDFKEAGLMPPSEPHLCEEAVYAAIGVWRAAEFLRDSADATDFRQQDRAQNAHRLGQRIYRACPPAYRHFILWKEDLLDWELTW